MNTRTRNALRAAAAAGSAGVFTMTLSGDMPGGNKFGVGVVAGETVDLNWGDGTIVELAGDAMQYPVHTYSDGEPTHLVTLTDRSHVSRLRLYETTIISVDAGEIGALRALTSLTVRNTPRVTISSGEVGSLTALTNLLVRLIPNATIAAGEIGAMTALDYVYLSVLAGATVSAGELSALTSLSGLLMHDVGSIAFASDEIIRGSNITITTTGTPYQVLSVAQVGFACEGVNRAGLSNGAIVITGHGVAEGDLDAAGQAAIATLRSRSWSVTIS